MDLTQLSCGARAEIVAVNCSAPLKERLRALGISRGNYLKLLKTSHFKKIFLVRTEGSLVAFGREVAECVIGRI